MGEARRLPLRAQLSRDRALLPQPIVDCANRTRRAAWAHHRLVLQQLDMHAAHGMRAERCEHDDRLREQREHAHATQAEGGAHRRRPRLRTNQKKGLRATMRARAHTRITARKRACVLVCMCVLVCLRVPGERICARVRACV